MAVGISHALNEDKDTDDIIITMIEAAREYDIITAQKWNVLTLTISKQSL